MKVIHVVAGLMPGGGGLSELVPRFALEAARLGHDVTLATVAGANDRLSEAAMAAAANGVKIVLFRPSVPQAFFNSQDMLRGLPELVRAADLVHVHSNWTFPVWWGSQCALRAGKPLVMSPQGCLDPVRLAHSAWKKRLAGLLDRRYLRQAAAIHATSDMERDWIERYLGKGPRICVIPNGVEIQEAVAAAVKPADRKRRALCLGRLHPLKGLDLLLDAWAVTSQLEPSAKTWELVISGPDEKATQTTLEAQSRTLGLTNVLFPGPLYGDEKRLALADADLFALPSRTENFGMVVTEALAAGLPVITTKGTPWSEIEGKAGWWVDVNAHAIANALAAAMRLSDAERAAMGARGRELVATKYRWESVGRAMVAVYEAVVDGSR